MSEVLHERGYIIPAFNTATVDYESCAARLEASLRKWHPDANITVITKAMLPYGDQGGYANDWQLFYATPYRETIKLEADMLCASPIDHWWPLLRNRDVVISVGARDFRDKHIRSRHYRGIFDANHLPDVYNAITYWRRSATAKEFFDLVRNIFEYWSEWQKILTYPEAEPSTDVVYGMAAQIVGVEQVTLPAGIGPNIVHMKKHAIGSHTASWSHELIWESDPLRIQTLAQWGLFHYHDKTWTAS